MARIRTRRAGALGALLAGFLAASAAAVLPQQSGRVDTLTQANVRIDGEAAAQVSGEAVAGAGDVNGDGIGDVIVGAGTGSAAYCSSGAPTRARLTSPRSGRAASRSRARTSSATPWPAWGDMNGDGRSEVAVSAPGVAKAFVIFGKASPTSVNVAALGSAGFEITGPSGGVGRRRGRELGRCGRRAGGRPRAQLQRSRERLGRRLRGVRQVELDCGEHRCPRRRGGYLIGGAATNHGAGDIVAGGRDVNGDGVADQVVGRQCRVQRPQRVRRRLRSVWQGIHHDRRPERGLRAASGSGPGRQRRSRPLRRARRRHERRRPLRGGGRLFVRGQPVLQRRDGSSGSAYVVFGKASNTAVGLATSGWGFRVDGVEAGDQAARSLGGGGDVNGDGLPDVVVERSSPTTTAARTRARPTSCSERPPPQRWTSARSARAASASTAPPRTTRSDAGSRPRATSTATGAPT